MLPKIPYIMRKNKRQTVAMGGINYSGVLHDGDIADSKGISARAYPYITTRKSKSKLPYTAVDSMTVFQGKMVTVRGGNLYWGGELIGNIEGGEKQFAAVNTKLVIMPDKVYLDATDKKIKPLGAIVRGGGATFTKDSVTVKNDTVVLMSGYGGTFKNNILTVTLKETVWDGSADMFYIESSGNVAIEPYVSIGVGTAISSNTLRHDWGLLDVNIEDMTGIIQVAGRKHSVRVEKTDSAYGVDFIFDSDELIEGESYATDVFVYNRIGVGAEYDITTDYFTLTAAKAEYVFSNTAYFKLPEGASTSIGWGHATVVRKNWDALNSVLNVGDPIAIFDDVTNKYVQTTVKAVTATTLTLADSISDQTDSSWAIYGNLADGSIPLLSDSFKVGDVVKVKGGSNDLSFQISKIEGNVLYADSEIFTAEAVDEIVTVERAIPDLDFICESENRLWGCSNKERTIFASALGDPTNIYTYQGVSTDSYAVPVGSEEDFTGCIAYGGSVLFFKEMKLHKILGSFPAEYMMYSYDFEGVQKGSHKSLAIVNEVLYFKGIHGVYAFTGSPTLISANFGEREFYHAVAGSDGDTYYISMTDREVKSDSESYLFAYETEKRIWVLEDHVSVSDFARIGGTTYALESGEVWLYGANETSADDEWLVQFTPLYESIEGRKSYSRILLRVELPLGSYLIVEARFDSGAWLEAGKVIGSRQDVIPIMIPINRCDKFELRIKGKGKCTIHNMLREYYVRGDK
jgi:hypothetical protein